MKKSVVDHEHDQVFSVPFHSIMLSKPILYDLYANFTGDGGSNKYIRAFPVGEVLEKEDVKRIEEKHTRVYVLEEQRSAYLRSLVSADGMKDEEKTDVIKNSAIDYLDKLFEPDTEYSTELLSSSVKKCHDVVEVMVDLVQDYSIDALQDHIAKLSFHDFYTYDHSVNVSMYCISFYRYLKPTATDEELSLAGLGGILHDIGKIRISTSIINNPGKLSDEEFQEVKRHTWYGLELLCESDFTPPKGIDLEKLKRIVFEHHENFDGSGYPEGLAGESIDYMARLTAICDFFDAVTTKRAYGAVLSTEEALAIMAKTVGKKLDPELFEHFCLHSGGKKPAKNTVSTLEEGFDPCQPHQGLPLKGFRHKKLGED